MMSWLAILGCAGGVKTETPSTPIDDSRIPVPGTRWVGTDDLQIGHAVGGRFDGETGEIAFNEVGVAVYVRDASFSGGDLRETARLHLEGPFVADLPTRVRPVGDVDGDGKDDLSTFGLFMDLPSDSTTLTIDDAVESESLGTRRCDVNSDGQDDLCTGGSVALGPNWWTPHYESGTCEPRSFNAQGLAAGWDEQFAASQNSGDGRQVAFAMTRETAETSDPCALNAERVWTIPTALGYPWLRTAELSGDERTDIAIAASNFESGAEGGVYIITGPEGTGDPANPADVRDAPIHIVVEPERSVRFLYTGDFDGDGATDLVFGMKGEVRIYRGPFSPGVLLPEDATVSYRDDAAALNTEFGWFADVYDLDADGQDDLILTDRTDDEGGTDAGKIYIVWSGGIGSGTREQ
jgi:hypothetical protein